VQTTAVLGDGWHEVPEVGPRLGRYELRGLLGAGGMGAVFEAFDPILDRAVAVKVLRQSRAGLDDHGAGRLLREGMTMARLAHPNVIRVYDLGVESGHVYVAMELVRGCTLAEWVKRAPRAPDEIIDAYLQAGRGLAAAHEAGLVHRDFKPQNVLVGDDGRVLVTDFGLARSVGDEEPTEPFERVHTPLPDVTQPGKIVGTPGFMAPEQRTGDAVDARADQYSFCVALAGDLGTVPARIRPAVQRGQAAAPEARFGSMRELLAQLAPPARRWVVPAAVGGGAIAAALVAAAFVWSLGTARAPETCPAPADRLARVWGVERQRALRERFAAVDPVHGPARYDAAARAIDPYAAAWSTAHVETCKDTRVRGQQSDTMLDLRMRCLDRRLGELDGSVALLVSAKDGGELDAALGALFQLGSLAACADGEELARRTPLPSDPTQRRAVEALTVRIEQAELEARADRLLGLPARADGLVAEARALDHPLTLSAALATAARAHLAAGEDEAAVTALRELTQVAARAGDERAEANGWIALVATVGARQLRPDEALTLVPAASAAVHRTRDPIDLRVDLLVAEAKVLDEGTRLAEALDKLGQAARLLDESGGDLPLELARRRADVLAEQARASRMDGRTDDAVALYLAAIELDVRLFGPDSLDEAIDRHNLGETFRWAGRLPEAIEQLRGAARINRDRMGDSPRLASNLVGIAAVLAAQNDLAGAAAAYDEAIAMLRSQVGERDVALVPPLVGLAEVLGNLERFDDAERAYDELFAVIDAAHATTINGPIALYNRAEMFRKRAGCDRALDDYRRSAEGFESIQGASSGLLPYPLIGEGECLVSLRRARAAIAPLERAISILGDDADPQQLASARRWLGRARRAR
jgi:tetratricopeptide (TPR) repeat protein